MFYKIRLKHIENKIKELINMKIPMEELITLRTVLRLGAVKIILQDETDYKKNKELIYNGSKEVSDDTIIYLVEK